jgi:hypothetical protein
MGRKLVRLFLATVLIGGVGLGCNRQVVQQKVPPDPLLTSKKPLEGKPNSAESAFSARLEAPAPPAPALGQPLPSVPPTVTVKGGGS